MSRTSDDNSQRGILAGLRDTSWREGSPPDDKRYDAPSRSAPTLGQLLDLTPLNTAAAQALDAEREAEEALRAAESRDRERTARADAVNRERAQRFGLRS